MIALLVVLGVFAVLAYYFVAQMLYQYWKTIFSSTYDSSYDAEFIAGLMAIFWPVSWVIKLICQWVAALGNYGRSLGKKLSKAGSK